MVKYDKDKKRAKTFNFGCNRWYCCNAMKD